MNHNLWLPFTPNKHFHQQLPTLPRVFVAADKMHFTTSDGRTVLDGVSSLWCVGAGHNRREINEAIKAQLDTLDYGTAFQFGNDRAFEAAQMIADLCPSDLNRVLFTNSGSEAADTAMKVALAYHRAKGEAQRTVFVGREKAYHGVGFGGMSVGGIPANRHAFSGALLPRIDHLQFPHDSVNHAYVHNTEPVWAAAQFEALMAELESRIIPLHGAGNIAAVMVEPVLGSAGWYIPPKGYLNRLRDMCDKHGILLIFDEVITGFGRLGGTATKAFAADFYGVVPDMLTFAKCVTNGVQPLGGVVCRDFIYEQIVNPKSSTASPAHAIEFFHGYTYSGHPVACAAAVATMKLLKEEDLFARAGQMGAYLGDALHAACTGLPNVVGIRSLGLAGAVELASIAGLAGKRAYDVFVDCFGRGVLVRSAGENLVLCPPYIVSKVQIDEMVGVLAAAIRRAA